MVIILMIFNLQFALWIIILRIKGILYLFGNEYRKDPFNLEKCNSKNPIFI